MKAGVKPGERGFDLHLHSCWSHDAATEPGLYFQAAREMGVRCIAFTEHFNADSVEEAASIGENYPEMRVVRGIELTAATSLGDVHILCYGIPLVRSGEFGRVLDRYRRWVRDAGSAVLAGLKGKIRDYTCRDYMRLLSSYKPERVLEKQGVVKAGDRILSSYLLRGGLVKSEEELAAVMGSFELPPFPHARDVIPGIKRSGALAVIAHPSGYFRGREEARMDALKEECYLDGIECAHSRVDPELTPFYRDYCIKHGMVSTAGSDCHYPEEVAAARGGAEIAGPRFAVHAGEEKWLDEFLERLGPKS